VDNFHKTVDNFLSHITCCAPDSSGAGDSLPYYQNYNRYEQMENGERQGKNQNQQRGGNYLPAQWAQSQWQHTNGEHYER